jgi:hypothetical protein
MPTEVEAASASASMHSETINCNCIMTTLANAVINVIVVRMENTAVGLLLR